MSSGGARACLKTLIAGAEVTRLQMLWKTPGLVVEEVDLLTSTPAFQTARARDSSPRLWANHRSLRPRGGVGENNPPWLILFRRPSRAFGIGLRGQPGRSGRVAPGGAIEMSLRMQPRVREPHFATPWKCGGIERTREDCFLARHLWGAMTYVQGEKLVDSLIWRSVHRVNPSINLLTVCGGRL